MLLSSSGSYQLKKAAVAAVLDLEKSASDYSDLESPSEDLPAAFHGVAKAISPAVDALNALQLYIKGQSSTKKEAEKDIEKKTLESATKFASKASDLCKIFGDVLPSDARPRHERYKAAAANYRGRIEVLMKEILETIISIAQPPVITAEQAAVLSDTLQEVSKIPCSLKEEDIGNTFNHYGTGHMNTHLGKGNININDKNGSFWAGEFSGNFNFPSSPHPPI